MSSLTDSRVRHGAKACVDAVHRADYPKFNKVLLSQCEHPEKYGVRLEPDAAAAIKALDAPKNRVERRKKTNRYYFRLTDGGAEVLQQLCEAMHCASSEPLRKALGEGGETAWDTMVKICT